MHGQGTCCEIGKPTHGLRDSMAVCFVPPAFARTPPATHDPCTKLTSPEVSSLLEEVSHLWGAESFSIVMKMSSIARGIMPRSWPFMLLPSMVYVFPVPVYELARHDFQGQARAQRDPKARTGLRSRYLQRQQQTDLSIRNDCCVVSLQCAVDCAARTMAVNLILAAVLIIHVVKGVAVCCIKLTVAHSGLT